MRQKTHWKTRRISSIGKMISSWRHTMITCWPCSAVYDGRDTSPPPSSFCWVPWLSWKKIHSLFRGCYLFFWGVLESSTLFWIVTLVVAHNFQFIRNEKNRFPFGAGVIVQPFSVVERMIPMDVLSHESCMIRLAFPSLVTSPLRLLPEVATFRSASNITTAIDHLHHHRRHSYQSAPLGCCRPLDCSFMYMFKVAMRMDHIHRLNPNLHLQMLNYRRHICLNGDHFWAKTSRNLCRILRCNKDKNGHICCSNVTP